ncbi:MAG: hypothetical protein V8S94_01395 [Methanobrevibacter smithii]
MVLYFLSGKMPRYNRRRAGVDEKLEYRIGIGYFRPIVAVSLIPRLEYPNMKES